MLGECKWGANRVGREVIQGLLDKASKVAPGADWQIHYAFFAPAGFTEAAHQAANAANARLIDLSQLDNDLQAAIIKN